MTICTAGEHFEYLDPLLDTNRELCNATIRIDLKAEGCRQFADPCALRFAIDETAFGDFHAEKNVFGNGQRRHQLEVLVHHAETERDRLARRIHHHRFTINAQNPCVWLVEAEEDIHQRRLSSTVLPDQRMDLALANREIDVAVGRLRAEAFCDAGHFDRVSHQALIVFNGH